MDYHQQSRRKRRIKTDRRIRMWGWETTILVISMFMAEGISASGSPVLYHPSSQQQERREHGFRHDTMPRNLQTSYVAKKQPEEERATPEVVPLSRKHAPSVAPILGGARPLSGNIFNKHHLTRSPTACGEKRPYPPSHSGKKSKSAKGSKSKSSSVKSSKSPSKSSSRSSSKSKVLRHRDDPPRKATEVYYPHADGTRRDLKWQWPSCAPSAMPSLSQPTISPVPTQSPTTPVPTQSPTTASPTTPVPSRGPSSTPSPAEPPDLPTQSPVSPSTSSPTETPSDQPSFFEVVISVSPFSVVYTLDDPSTPADNEFALAGETTSLYINALYTGFFDASADVLLESVDSTFGSFGVNPVSIDFETVLRFSRDSVLIPTQAQLDSLMSSFFQPPAVQALVNALTDVPASDPFSTTTTAEYVGPTTQSSLARHGPLSQTSQDLTASAAGAFFSIMFLGVLSFCFVRRRHRQRHSRNGKQPRISANRCDDSTVLLSEDDVISVDSRRLFQHREELEIVFEEKNQDREAGNPLLFRPDAFMMNHNNA